MEQSLRRGPDQDVSFGLILWYISKTIPDLLEYEQFVIYSSYVFFDLFLLFGCWIEDRSNYYKINFRYTYVFKFCYNDIWLWFVPCFGAESEIMYILLVYICFPCINTKHWLQRSRCSCVYINSTIWLHSISINPTRKPLKDGAISGVSQLWWGRSWLRHKFPGFR